MYHVSFTFKFKNDPIRRFGKIIFNYLENTDRKLDIAIKLEIFESMRKSIDSIGIISVFENSEISEDEKYSFDLYINYNKDWYYSCIH